MPYMRYAFMQILQIDTSDFICICSYLNKETLPVLCIKETCHRAAGLCWADGQRREQASGRPHEAGHPDPGSARDTQAACDVRRQAKAYLG